MLWQPYSENSEFLFYSNLPDTKALLTTISSGQKTLEPLSASSKASSLEQKITKKNGKDAYPFQDIPIAPWKLAATEKGAAHRGIRRQIHDSAATAQVKAEATRKTSPSEQVPHRPPEPPAEASHGMGALPGGCCGDRAKARGGESCLHAMPCGQQQQNPSANTTGPCQRSDCNTEHRLHFLNWGGEGKRSEGWETWGRLCALRIVSQEN